MQSSGQITTNKPTPNFLQAGCPSCRQTNSVKALKGNVFLFSNEIPFDLILLSLKLVMKSDELATFICLVFDISIMGKFCHTNDGNLSKQQKWLALGFRLEIRLKLLARMQFSADLMISASCWCLHFCLIYKHWYRYMSSKQSCHIMGSLRG